MLARGRVSDTAGDVVGLPYAKTFGHCASEAGQSSLPKSTPGTGKRQTPGCTPKRKRLQPYKLRYRMLLISTPRSECVRLH